MQSSVGVFVAILAVFVFTGCKSNTTATNTTVAPATAPVSALPTIRIDAGSTNSYTDSEGDVWLPDQGFADGDTTERDSSLQIANTKDPAIYRTEHYGMSAFSYHVPNGKYTVKLHFCETYDGITGPGQRVFSFNVEGQDFKDFDVWDKAGLAARLHRNRQRGNHRRQAGHHVHAQH